MYALVVSGCKVLWEVSEVEVYDFISGSVHEVEVYAFVESGCIVVWDVSEGEVYTLVESSKVL